MLPDLSPEALALAEYMSCLSEDAWRAGWMHNLEFRLWAAIQGDRNGYGRAKFNDDEIAKLKSLSDACRGWIVFHESAGETFVPLPEWTRIFAEHEAARGGDGRRIG